MDFGFVIGRCIRGPAHMDLCYRCYESVRKVYPSVPILIVDDNSTHMDTHTYDANTLVVMSTFRGMGEFGLYHYYWKLHPFERAVVIHDSMIVRSPLPLPDEDVAFLWHFPNKAYDSDINHLVRSMLQRLTHTAELLEVYAGTSWKGCFGVSSTIKWAYLDHLVAKYDLWAICGAVNYREMRCAIERLFAVLCFHDKGDVQSLFGDIFAHPHAYRAYDPATLDTHLPVIKTWTGR